MSLRLHAEVIDLKTKHPFIIARGSRDTYRTVVVKLTDKDGLEGWGEAAPQRYYGETAETVLAAPDTMVSQIKRGVLDMIGNLWEWNLTIWGTDNSSDPSGYVYRNYRGGAWNVSNPEYLRAIDRGAGHSPRGQLNDAGFRAALQFS